VTTDKEFAKMLARAISGQRDALGNLLEMYLPLVNRYSYIDGRLNEDLRQHILLQILETLADLRYNLSGRLDLSNSKRFYNCEGNPHAPNLDNFTV